MNCDAPVEEGISIGAAETAGETSPLTTSVFGFATALSLNSALYVFSSTIPVESSEF